MNHHLSTLIGFSLLASLSWLGCEKQLTQLPLGVQTPNNQYGSAIGTEEALLNCYGDQQMLRLFLYSIDQYGNMGMGLSVASTAFQAVLAGQYPVDGETTREFWRYPYAIIRNSNQFLRDSKEFNAVYHYPARALEAEAEARAFRAYQYFRLARWFGGVPITTEANMDEWYPARNTEEEVYQFIIEEFQFCIDHLLEDHVGGLLSDDLNKIEYGRLTKWAAIGMLAEVYMSAPASLRNYPEAIRLMREITNSGRFALLDDWTHVFNPDYRVNAEGIWPTMLSGAWDGGGTKLGHYSTTAQTWWRPTDEMYAFYEEGDTRRDATILKGFRENYLEKYMQGLVGDNRDNHPFYYLRYADLLLTLSEALTVSDFQANKQEAVDLLNQVRGRANATLATPDEFQTQDQLLNAILDEVHKELYMEGQYWFHMKRNGAALTLSRTEQPAGDTYKMLLPLHVDELRANPNLIQNPGYADQ
jgi:hypothetical protein